MSFSLRDAVEPDVAIEIAAHRVSAARADVRGGRLVVAAHAVERLAPAVLSPGLTAANVHDRPALAAAVRAVLDQVGRPRRVGLVLPDAVAKVSILTFQHVPAREQELSELVRWQMKKAAPFPPDEAQISYAPGATLPDGREFVVVMARRDVVREYESLFDDLGVHAGMVDLSTFNVTNAVLAGANQPDGDWLLVNVAPDWASVAIVRGADPIFFRSRTSEGDGTLVDLAHQTAMYYEDRLGGRGFARVLMSGASDALGEATEVDRLRQTLQARLGAPVEAVDPLQGASLADRISASPALLDVLAPLVGLLARERGAAA